MRSGTIKLIVTFAIVIGGVTFLALQSSGDVEYYVHVDKVVDKPTDWTDKKTVQIHGFARKVPLKATVNGQMASRRFELTQEGKTISVYHEGPVPDTFKDEAETVVKGRLEQLPDGTLLLTTVGGEQGIMAKCPSKYEAKK